MPGSLARSLAGVVAACLLSLCTALPVAADPPENLAGELTDHVGLLTDQQAVVVEQAQDRLVATKGLQLFVVLVDDFDAMTPAAWMEQTATLSGLGDQDMAIALADDTGQLAVRVPEATRLDRAAVDSAESAAHELVAQGEHAAGVLSLVEGLDAAPQIDPAARVTRLLWWALAAVVVAGLLGGLYLKVTSAARQRRRDAEDLTAARELARRTGSTTVALDDAVETARLDVEFAAAEFDPPLVASIRETVEAADAQSVEAHRRRAAVATGPVDDPQWQLPPAKALAELREIEALSTTALTRLTTVSSQLNELRRQSDLVPTRIAGLRTLAASAELDSAAAGQVRDLLDRAAADVAADRPEAALLPLQTVVALLGPDVSERGSAAASPPDRG